MGRAKKTGLTLTPLAGKKTAFHPLSTSCFLYRSRPNMVPSKLAAAKPGPGAPLEKVLHWPTQWEIIHNSTKAFLEKKCQINPPEHSLLPQSSLYANLFRMPSVSRAELHGARNIISLSIFWSFLLLFSFPTSGKSGLIPWDIYLPSCLLSFVSWRPLLGTLR